MDWPSIAGVFGWKDRVRRVADFSGERGLPACTRRQLADEKPGKKIFRLAAETSRLAACAPQGCSCRRHRRQNRAENLPLKTATAITLRSLPECLPSSRRLKHALRQFSA